MRVVPVYPRWSLWLTGCILGAIVLLFSGYMTLLSTAARPISRSALVGSWNGPDNVSLRLRADGTYSASGFRFARSVRGTGTWNIANEMWGTYSSVDLYSGKDSGEKMIVSWFFLTPVLTVYDDDPDQSDSGTALTRTEPP